LNILGMGTVRSYLKNVTLNMKWQEKKSEPLKVKDEDPRISELKQELEARRRGQTITSLRSKLLSGGSLTENELRYLKENSPEDYDKAVQVERERAQYKHELEKCRSKEDVKKLNERKLYHFSAEAKSISNTPDISPAKKRELLEFLCMRMAAIMNEHSNFQKQAQYQQLPENIESDADTSNVPVKATSLDETSLPRYNTSEDPMDAIKGLISRISIAEDGFRSETKLSLKDRTLDVRL
jgi:hypothetical protein